MNPKLWLAAVLVATLGACGGDDDTDSPTTTASPSPVASTAAATLPDACTLVSDDEAGTAMGTGSVAGVVPQPPSDVASRCEWASGQYALSLLIRSGANAKSSFDNAVDGFVETTVTGGEARIQLGARETARNYRLVAFGAWDGTYYVYFTLQGPDRDDAASTEIVTTLAATVLEALR